MAPSPLREYAGWYFGVDIRVCLLRRDPSIWSGGLEWVWAAGTRVGGEQGGPQEGQWAVKPSLCTEVSATPQAMPGHDEQAGVRQFMPLNKPRTRRLHCNAQLKAHALRVQVLRHHAPWAAI